MGKLGKKLFCEFDTEKNPIRIITFIAIILLTIVMCITNVFQQ